MTVEIKNGRKTSTQTKTNDNKAIDEIRKRLAELEHGVAEVKELITTKDQSTKRKLNEISGKLSERETTVGQTPQRSSADDIEKAIQRAISKSNSDQRALLEHLVQQIGKVSGSQSSPKFVFLSWVQIILLVVFSTTIGVLTASFFL